MSKILCPIFTFEDINKYAQAKADGVIFGLSGYATKLPNYLDITELTHYVDECKKNGIECYVFFNVFMHSYEETSIKNTLHTITNHDIDGIYVTDLGVLSLLEDMGKSHLVIYNPETLITNHFDASYWLQKGIKAVSVSKEIQLEDILSIANNIEGQMDMVIHGHLNMFHSKRKLISNYLNHINKHSNEFINNYEMHVIEEIREGKEMPIIEDEFGTNIYSSYELVSFQEIKELVQSGIQYLRIDPIFKSSEYALKVIRTYRGLLNKLFTKEFEEEAKVCVDVFKENSAIGSGFYYKRTKYIK